MQQAAAQLPWFHLCTLIDGLRTRGERDWHLAKAVEHGWSRGVLVMQIESRARERSGRAITKCRPLLIKTKNDNPTIGLLLCKAKNRVIVEYALRDAKKPIGVAEYQLVHALPTRLETGRTIDLSRTVPFCSEQPE